MNQTVNCELYYCIANFIVANFRKAWSTRERGRQLNFRKAWSTGKRGRQFQISQQQVQVASK